MLCSGKDWIMWQRQQKLCDVCVYDEAVGGQRPNLLLLCTFTFLHAACRGKYTTERKIFFGQKQEKYSTNNHADFMLTLILYLVKYAVFQHVP